MPHFYHLQYFIHFLNSCIISLEGIILLVVIFVMQLSNKNAPLGNNKATSYL